MVLVIKYQIRVQIALEMVMEARPTCSLSHSMHRGLEQLQKKMDDKVLRRLCDKTRKSVAISTAF